MRVTAGQNAYDFNCLKNVMSHAFSGQLHLATQVHIGNQESLFQFRAYANVIPGYLSMYKKMVAEAGCLRSSVWLLQGEKDYVIKYMS